MFGDRHDLCVLTEDGDVGGERAEKFRRELAFFFSFLLVEIQSKKYP